MMNAETIHQLNALNLEFYTALADAFATSRGPSEPGLERTLADLPAGVRVLDLGCGAGRVAGLLPPGSEYIALDFSPALLALAGEQAAKAGVRSHIIQADLLADDWPARIEGVCDCVVLRAVLHHLPGAENRQAVLNRAAGLLHPEGKLILANWQFLDIERLRRRIQSWSEIGLTEEQVEPGDYLLDWRREGQGLRYVHLVDEAETQALAAAADLRIVDLFRSDGKDNRLTLYAVLKH